MFDVAAVKRSLPGSPIPAGWQKSLTNRVQGREHGRYTMYQTPLKVYLQMAYQLPGYLISGPEWMDTERYDIVATMSPSTPDDQVLLMLQAVLAERFQLKLHRERKETSVYVLIVGKNGPKLKETASGTPPVVRPTPLSLAAENRSMSDLAGILMRWTDRPVVDMTGLSGFYDFKLDWRQDRIQPPDDAIPHPALASDPMAPLNALPSLGLKAEPRKVPLEFLIIDHAEKMPTEN